MCLLLANGCKCVELKVGVDSFYLLSFGVFENVLLSFIYPWNAVHAEIVSSDESTIVKPEVLF